MPTDSDIRSFVQRRLDGIEVLGRGVGRGIAWVLGNSRRIAGAVLAIAGFGLLVFIWAVVRGARSRKD